MCLAQPFVQRLWMMDGKFWSVLGSFRPNNVQNLASCLPGVDCLSHSWHFQSHSENIGTVPLLQFLSNMHFHRIYVKCACSFFYVILTILITTQFCTNHTKTVMQNLIWIGVSCLRYSQGNFQGNWACYVTETLYYISCAWITNHRARYLNLYSWNQKGWVTWAIGAGTLKYGNWHNHTIWI